MIIPYAVNERADEGVCLGSRLGNLGAHEQFDEIGRPIRNQQYRYNAQVLANPVIVA